MKQRQKNKNFIKLQFSSYQLSDIQDALRTLDYVLEATVNSAIYYKNKTRASVNIKQIKADATPIRYANQRVFVDTCKTLTTPSPGSMQKAQCKSKLYTVIRAAFAFKKTREQFSKHKHSYYIILNTKAAPNLQNFILNVLGNVNFPAELKLTVEF